MKRLSVLFLLCLVLAGIAFLFCRIVKKEKEKTDAARQELAALKRQNNLLVRDLLRQKTVISGVRMDNDPEYWRQLEDDLNRYEDNAVAKARALLPRCKEYQIRRLCLFFAGFSYPLISLITQDSVASLKQSKSRFRKTFRSLGTETGDRLATLLDGPETERQDPA